MTAKRPVLLDLFSGAGGAGMGYSRAGFDVTGVDIEPQKHYPSGRRRGTASSTPPAARTRSSGTGTG